MDPEAVTTSLFKWGDTRHPRLVVDPSMVASHHPHQLPPPPSAPFPMSVPVRPACRDLGGGLESLFQDYGIRHVSSYYSPEFSKALDFITVSTLPPPTPRAFFFFFSRYLTAAKIAELGFTVNTLLDMREEEIDDMMNSLSHIFRWELLVGERYGIKAAVRAERRRLEDEDAQRRAGSSGFHSVDTANYALDALSQEGLSEEPVQQVVQGRGEAGTWELAATTVVADQRKKHRRRKVVDADFEGENDQDEEERRQREHPFIVTEPGEVARGKKNGLDYLFHLYEQCREFLMQVQNAAKERGEKCPTKVTNQVFRYAKKVGASYINKPKMRHYVHCYALHCLDEEASNALRRELKERGENVGAWRQACYKPLVRIAAARGWDMDAIFNGHPRLSIWYVPTKLRQLCHAASTSSAVAAAPSSATAASAASTSSTPLMTY